MRRLGFFVLLLAGAALSTAVAQQPGLPRQGDFQFQDVTAELGLREPLAGMMAHAAAWGDVNGNGRPDLFVGGFCDRPDEAYIGAAGPVPNRLLLNTPDGFVRSPQPALDLLGRASGAVFVDLDNSGSLDLYVANNAVFPDPGDGTERRRAVGAVRNLLLRNDGRGNFTDVSERSGAIPPAPFTGRAIGVLDYNQDGLLDLLVIEDRLRNRNPRSRLYRNLGDFHFQDATAAAGLPDDLHGLGVAIADLNGDGYPDFYVSGSDRLFMSRGDGTYREATEFAELFAWNPRHPEDLSCGVAFGDLDGLGRLSLVVGNHFEPAHVRLYETGPSPDGLLRFRDDTGEWGLERPIPTKAPHVEIADFDNDGAPDVFFSAAWPEGNTYRPMVLQQVISGRLRRFTRPDLDGPMVYYPAAPTADFDGDGRLDILLADWWPERGTRLLRNETPGGNWLRVRVIGSAGAAPSPERRTNQMGIGARITVQGRPRATDTPFRWTQEITTGYGYSSGQEAIAHFGIGQEEVVDVEVRFPNGRALRREGVAANQLLVVREEEVFP